MSKTVAITCPFCSQRSEHILEAQSERPVSDKRAQLASYFRSNLSYLDNSAENVEQMADDVLELVEQRPAVTDEDIAWLKRRLGEPSGGERWRHERIIAALTPSTEG